MGDVERNGAGEHLTKELDNDTALQKIRTAGSISISPELFEKIYLSPENRVKGDLRKTFGNPTPICLAGFLLALTPLSMELMGWHGAPAAKLGAATVGTYYTAFALMLVGGIFELILGNTFPAVVFTSFSGFWFIFGLTLTPSLNAVAAYDPSGMGMVTQDFADSFAFWLLTMGILCFVYMIAALRTNIIFVLIFFLLVLTFPFLAAAFWYLTHDPMLAVKMQTGGGACAFAVAMLGWYLFFVQVLAAVDFPINLPVGDLSSVIKGASARRE